MIGGSIIRRGALLGGLGATGLAATGRFQAAAALTLGAVVAIVSALWLSGVAHRLPAGDRGPDASLSWKYGLKGFLRYALSGAILLGAVRAFPNDLLWILVGTSTVVASIFVEGVQEQFRVGLSGRGGGQVRPGAGGDDGSPKARGD